ncbi:MAG: RraA family protein [Actinomycetota bacterium]|nr:RraA family protein [Actinomycetota bacterium]
MAGKPKSAEMHPGPGFRIREKIDRPRQETIAALGAFETPAISDLMNRLYAMTPAIKNLTDEHLRLLGPATTVKCYPGDNLMVHKALDIASPGDVIVVDTSGQQNTAVLGDLVSTKARHRGVAGFLVDGLVRDIAGIRQLGDFPVYARDVTPIGPLHRGPGEINFPISAGGIVVQPGDVIVGDSNGVVVVPHDIADDMVRRLTAQQSAEADYTAAVARGEFNNNWVDQTLSDAGVPLVNGSNGNAPKAQPAPAPADRA